MSTVAIYILYYIEGREGVKLELGFALFGLGKIIALIALGLRFNHWEWNGRFKKWEWDFSSLN
jgi:hypothetical protein